MTTANENHKALFLSELQKRVKIPEGEFEAFFALWDYKKFKRNEFIQRAGEIPKFSVFVLDGILRQYLINEKVENFTNWKAGFEAGKGMREEVGVKTIGVYQDTKDENMVTLIFEVPNSDMARAMTMNPDFKAAMKKSGVISEPEIQFLSQVN